MMQRNSDDWPDHVHDHDRRHVGHNAQWHVGHEHDDNGSMVTIRVTRVNVGGMAPTGSGPAGLVAATVQVHVPAISCRAVLFMTFPAPAESTRANWAEIAYEKTLMMLDPAWSCRMPQSYNGCNAVQGLWNANSGYFFRFIDC
jgi:hypothetical protein